MDLALKTRVRASLQETGACRLPAQLEAVEPSVELLRDFARTHGISAEDFSAIELAAVEGLNNAAKHAAKGDPEATVQLRWTLSGGEIAIEIADSGHFAPGPEWFELPADPLAEGGRGGFLMKSLMDRVEHENGPAGHVLRMSKRLNRAAARPNPADLERELAAMTQDLSDSYESLAALFSISTLLATTPDFSSFLAEVLARLRTLVSAEKAYVRFAGADGVWRMGGLSGSDEARPDHTAAPSTSEQKAWREQRELTVEDSDSLPESDPLRTMSAGGFICPLAFANQPIGVLVVGRRTGGYFTAGQLNLVRTVGDYLAIACTTAELHKQRESQQRVAREVQIAASIQQSLLPRHMPVVSGWDIEGRCHSANEVGGDYFDLIEKPGSGFLVVIADVMGKGLPAALLATIFRTSVRARLDLADDPGQLLSAINRQLYADLTDLNMFITAQFAWFDTAGNRALITSAGHGDPLVVRPADGTARPLQCHGGMPLGIVPDHAYVADRFDVECDDTVLFITDGLYEIEGTDGRQLGMSGLAELARSLPPDTARNFASALLRALAQVGRKDQQADDRTLVVVKRSPSP